MNPQPELESDALRSEIDTTRGRMDETIDALGDRLGGRHLVDELLGFFRGRAGEAGQVGQRLGRSAESAVRSVADSVKAHPVPAIVAGAGVAWLIYEMTASKRAEADIDPDYESSSSLGRYEDYSEPKTAPTSGSFGESEYGVAQRAKDKLSEFGDQAREKLGEVKERSGEKLQAARERIGDVAGQVQERGRELYGRTREAVVTTTQEHPLEVGLGFLAAGFLVGLAVPTPSVVHRRIGPAVDRVRERTRVAGQEIVEKGKRVMVAATHAAKNEADEQGLFPGKTGEPTGSNPGAGGEEGIAVTNEIGAGAERREGTNPGPS